MRSFLYCFGKGSGFFYSFIHGFIILPWGDFVAEKSRDGEVLQRYDFLFYFAL